MVTKSSHTTVAPALGEEAALRGYTNQYLVAAELSYSALKTEDFEKLVLKHDGAGQVDDLVIVRAETVEAYQVKWSVPPSTLTFSLFKNYLRLLLAGRRDLSALYTPRSITTYIYTSNHASSAKLKDDGKFSSFLSSYWSNPKAPKANDEWKQTRSTLSKELKISVDELHELRGSLKFVLNRLHIEDREEFDTNDRYYADIQDLASKLLQEAGRKDGVIELDRSAILRLTGWDKRIDFRSRHVFEVTRNYVPIDSTVDKVKVMVKSFNQGYVALVGSPGSGKSTLLTKTLRYTSKVRVIPYYCFIPNDQSVQKRAEAGNFLHDLVMAIKAHGVETKNLTPSDSIEQLRVDLEKQLTSLGQKYKKDGILTVVLVDGLDHVKREGNPIQSLLRELPKPSALPNGVLFVLGTQSVDSLDISPEIKNEFRSKEEKRKIKMDPLGRRGVADVAGLALPGSSFSDDDIDKLMEKSGGHPLALNYILNALRTCASGDRSAKLTSMKEYEGNIEQEYERYWADLEGDGELLQLFALLSRIRGNLDFEIIEQLASTNTLNELTKTASQYFEQASATQWKFFHNSFRQFILDRTGRSAFKVDSPQLHRKFHAKLAELAASQPESSLFHWEYIYHAYHSNRFEDVVQVGEQSFFRNQFFSGRSAESIYSDIKLLMVAAKECSLPVGVIRALLIYEEISSRASILEEIDLPELLVDLGKVEEAVEHIYFDGRLLSSNFSALEFSIVLADAGYRDIALKIFEAAEPIGELDGNEGGFDTYGSERVIDKWLEASLRFRSVSEIKNLLKNVSIETLIGPKGIRDPNADRKEAVERFYEKLFDTILTRGTVGMIDQLGDLLSDVVDEKKLKVRLAIDAIRNDAVGSVRKRKGLEVLKGVGFEDLSEQQRISIAGYLVIESNDRQMADAIVEKLLPPLLPTDETYISREWTFSFYMRLFRFHRISTAVGNPIQPKTALVDVGDPDHTELVTVGRQVVALANLWGKAWGGGALEAKDFLVGVRPSLQFLENCRQSSASGRPDPLSGFRNNFVEIIIHTAASHGQSCVKSIQEELVERWTHESKKTAWGTELRRFAVSQLIGLGGDRAVLLRELAAVDEEDRVSDPEVDLRDYLEKCKEKALEWKLVNDVQLSDSHLNDLISSSFGIVHDKDTQILNWTELYCSILEVQPSLVVEDLPMFVAGVTTNSKFGRSSYSAEACAALLSGVLQYNPRFGKQLRQFLLDEGGLEYFPAVAACLSAALESNSVPVQIILQKFLKLYLPYVNRVDKQLLEKMLLRLCQEPSDADDLVMLLVTGLKRETPPGMCVNLLQTVSSCLEKSQCSQEIRNLTAQSIVKAIPSSEGAPRTISLLDGEEISEAQLLTIASDPAEFVELLEKCATDGYYDWAVLIRSTAGKLSEEQLVRAFDALIRLGQKGRKLVPLLQSLVEKDDLVNAARLGKKAVDESDSNGWIYYFDGGSRIAPYKVLVGLDEEYRQQAIDTFVGDFIQGFRPYGLSQSIADFIDLFWTRVPYDSLWPEIRQHISQLREFSTPGVREPDFSISEQPPISLSQVLLDSLFESLTFPHSELRSGGFRCIVSVYDKVAELEDGIESRINKLLKGKRNDPLLGIALLDAISSDDNLESSFVSMLESYGAHLDMAVRIAARDLLSRNGIILDIKHSRDLGPSYQLELPEYNSTEMNSAAEALDPGSVLRDIGDPLQIVAVAQDSLMLISRHSNIAFRNLVERCAALMRQIVPENEWDSAAEKEIQEHGQRLRIKLSYRRPRPRVASLALGYLVAELYDGSRIDERLLSLLSAPLAIYDSKLGSCEPISSDGLNTHVLLTKEDDRNSREWLEERPSLPAQPPVDDTGAVTIGFVTESSLPTWAVMEEKSAGSLVPSSVELRRLNERHELLIPGTAMSIWWCASMYPSLPYLRTALEYSYLITGSYSQRVEIGDEKWLAINPLIAKELGWSFSEEGFFRWINDEGEVMVESVWWRSGRTSRTPHVDDVCSTGWIVRASLKGFEEICSSELGLQWGCSIEKSGKDLGPSVWVELAEV